MNAATLRVMIVEDEPLFRDLLVRALEGTGGVQVVSCCATVTEARAAHARARTPLHAALLDIDLGQDSGIALGRELRAASPDLGIVLLSNHAHLAFARDLIEQRLTGWAYLLKRSVQDIHTVRRAIENVVGGGVTLDAQLTRGQTFDPEQFPGLTPQLLTVWGLITQGYSNAAIARQLTLSLKRTDALVGLLYGALDIDTRDPDLNPRATATLLYAHAAQQAHVRILRPLPDDLEIGPS